MVIEQDLFKVVRGGRERCIRMIRLLYPWLSESPNQHILN